MATHAAQIEKELEARKKNLQECRSELARHQNMREQYLINLQKINALESEVKVLQQNEKKAKAENENLRQENLSLHEIEKQLQKDLEATIRDKTEIQYAFDQYKIQQETERSVQEKTTKSWKFWKSNCDAANPYLI